MDVIHILRELMKHEYKIIPDKERIGKGSVYIAKTVGLQCYKWLIGESSELIDFLKFIDELIQLGDKEDDRNLYNLGLVLFAYCVSETGNNIDIAFNELKKYATHSNWEIREMAGYAIRECLKTNKQETINSLWSYVHSKDENLRRIVSESLRPLADIPWLRNPDRNGSILELLEILKADPSVYVRKSVGNNLKDLSKYMPEIVLDQLKLWSHQYKIKVTDDLASKTKHQLGEKEFYFVWMMKHALRWIKERNPEYHPQITDLLGKNYVAYFNEKKNRLAKPSM
jgi:3-methyladenine DNA glycosylase AlkC